MMVFADKRSLRINVLRVRRSWSARRLLNTQKPSIFSLKMAKSVARTRGAGLLFFLRARPIPEAV